MTRDYFIQFDGPADDNVIVGRFLSILARVSGASSDPCCTGVFQTIESAAEFTNVVASDKYSYFGWKLEGLSQMSDFELSRLRSIQLTSNNLIIHMGPDTVLPLCGWNGIGPFVKQVGVSEHVSAGHVSKFSEAITPVSELLKHKVDSFDKNILSFNSPYLSIKNGEWFRTFGLRILETVALEFVEDVILSLEHDILQTSVEFSGSYEQLKGIHVSGNWRTNDFPLSCNSLIGLGGEYVCSLGREGSRLPIPNISRDEVPKLLAEVASGYHNRTFSAIVWSYLDWDFMRCRKYFRDDKLVLFKDHKGRLRIAISIAMDPECSTYQLDVVNNIGLLVEGMGGKMKVANYFGR